MGNLVISVLVEPGLVVQYICVIPETTKIQSHVSPPYGEKYQNLTIAQEHGEGEGGGIATSL